MLLNTWHTTIDDRGRTVLPTGLHAQLNEGLIATCGFDRCLQIYPRSAWEKLATRISALPLSDARARQLRRLVFSFAQELTADETGAVTLTEPLRNYAQLASDIVFTGLNTYLEVWSDHHWRDTQQTLTVNAATLAEVLGEQQQHA
jgi:MraZ protein